LGPGEDQVGERRDGGAWEVEPCAEVIPEADAEFGAGLGERTDRSPIEDSPPGGLMSLV
jgi:hypothetical protein